MHCAALHSPKKAAADHEYKTKILSRDALAQVLVEGGRRVIGI